MRFINVFFFFSNLFMMLIFQGANLGCDKYLRNKRFDVFIPSEHANDEQVLELVRWYKKKNKIWFWASILSNFLLFVQTKHFSLVNAYFMTWMFVVIGYKMGLIGSASDKLKRIKKERYWFDSERDKEEDFWHKGMFYYNPNSTKILISQPGSMNSTVNLATKKGKFFLIILVLIIFFSTVPISFLLLYDDFIPPKITLDQDVFTIKSAMYDSEIHLDDIERIEIIEDEGHKSFRGAKQNGAATELYSRGRFYVGAYEVSDLFIFHETLPVIIIYPSNQQRTILFNDDSAESTYELYEELLEKIDP